jgi:hypothetical protein
MIIDFSDRKEYNRKREECKEKFSGKHFYFSARYAIMVEIKQERLYAT